MATLTIEFDHDDIKRLIANELGRMLPAGIKVRTDALFVEVKPTGSDKWEIAHVRFRYFDTTLR